MSHIQAMMSSISLDNRWDPEYYDPRASELKSALLAAGAVPLASLATSARRGFSPDYKQNGAIPVVNSVNVRELEFSEERASFVDKSALNLKPLAAVRQNDLVITSTGIGTLGRVFLNISDKTFFADGHITIVTLQNPQLGPYICAFLQSPLGRAQFIQRRRGPSRQVEIYPEDVLSVLIPTFSDSQELGDRWLRCVDEMAMARANYPAAEALLLQDLGFGELSNTKWKSIFSSTMANLGAASRFDAEFFSPQNAALEALLNRKCALRLGDILGDPIKGVQPSQYNYEGEAVVIKSKDVKKFGIDVSSCDRAEIEHLDGDAGSVKKDMVCINMTGVGTLGRAAVVPLVANPLFVSVDVSAWQVTNKSLPAAYVALFLNSAAGMAQTLRHQIGSSGQLHIYPQHIQNLLIHAKRTKSGKIDSDWCIAIAGAVEEGQALRVNAISHLNSIKTHLMNRVGLTPRIFRE